MARDPMLVEFLKKESATTALIIMLARFNICTHISRPMKREPKGIYVSSYDIKQFCTAWVKGNREQ